MLDRETLAGQVIVSASVGEEMVEGVALGHILKRYSVDRVVICEPTGLRLGVGHKGRAGVGWKPRARRRTPRALNWAATRSMQWPRRSGGCGVGRVCRIKTWGRA
jgi:hypothetical protein